MNKENKITSNYVSLSTTCIYNATKLWNVRTFISDNIIIPSHSMKNLTTQLRMYYKHVPYYTVSV